MTDAERFLPPLLQFVQKAGELALAIQATAAQEFKQDKSVVTEADLAISKKFGEFIASLPDADNHFVIDEESIGSVAEAQAAMRRKKYTWVIDPIDGTGPYAHGLPLWGVMVALFADDKPLLAVINMPGLGETIYTDGNQTYLLKNRIGASAAVPHVRPTELRPSSIVIAGMEFHHIQTRGALTVLEPHAAATFAAFTILGRARGGYFGFGMKLWDVAIVLPFTHTVGLKLFELNSGVPVEKLSDIKISDDWKPHDMFVLCHPDYATYLRDVAKSA